ncbi:hypothetical protein FLL10_15615 [Salmonella enterica]|nr:hypothetical protein [Salmonella enterica]
MFVAAGQFVVSSVWEENAQVCVSLMAQAAGRGVSLLVLPEGILARNDIDLDLPIRAAQPLDTTCYMIAAGECGNRNIGQSRIIDPLGVTIAAAADRPALIVAEIFRERIDQVREQLPLLQQRRFAPPQLL